MSLTVVDTVALLVAGTGAGLVGTAGGITSAISYPALLAVGLPAVSANVANNVSLVACLPGAALASGPELKGQAAWLLRWSLLVAAGSGAGAALLLVTPSGAFEHIVPFLIAAGSLALLLEPHLTAWRTRRHSPGRSIGLPAGLFVLSLYNGYFGAGAGVMVLTLVLVFVNQHLHTANALKNMFVGAGSITCAVVYAICTSVTWSAVLPLGIGMFIGSSLGPRVARRIPAGILPRLIALLGFALAIVLLIDPGL